MWKWVVGIVVLLVVLAGGIGAMVFASGGASGIQAQFKRQEKATEVRIEEVKRGELARSISAPGTVESLTVVKVGARVSSTITALPFPEGADVKEGDVIARLDDVELRARLDAANSRLRVEQAQLEGTKASLRLSEIELGRQRELYSTKDVAKSVLDQAEAEHARLTASVLAAEASIEAARAEIQEREKDLANCIISSPLSGTITKLDMKVGEQVLGTQTNAGTVIMEISDLASMIMNARVDETSIAPVKPGQAVKVFLNAYPNREFAGTVLRVKNSKQLDRDGTSYFATEVRLMVPEGERMEKTGLTANCEIEVEKFEDVVKVPSQSVLDRRVEDLPKSVVDSSPEIDKTKTFARVVYLMVDGKSVARPVTVGASDLTHTVVTGGLSSGDKIIVGPYKVLTTLKHDQLLKDMDAPAAPAGAPVTAEAKAEEKPAEGDSTGGGSNEGSTPGTTTSGGSTPKAG